MKVAVLGAISFAFLFVTGMGLPVAVPEALRMMLWGIALLSLSAGAKGWMGHPSSVARVLSASEQMPQRNTNCVRKSALEMLAESRG